METIQMVSFKKAINILTALKCEYAIIEPSGEKHGNLKVVDENEPPKISYGELSNYITPYLEPMNVGDTFMVPVGPYSLDSIQTRICNWFGKRHGNSSVITRRRPDEGMIEVYRVN